MPRPAASDTTFGGSIPELYDRVLVPLIFEPYAADLAARAAALAPARVLETAAGTGVVTRVLAQLLPGTTRIVATDLNPPMLARAGQVGTTRPVQWLAADALALPFEDASFDLVLCQFGVMFFPDKVRGFAEARRVLRPGGTLLFNAWDTIEHNEFPCVVTEALAGLYPADPPRFMVRTPHGYHDRERIVQDVVAAGFAAASLRIQTLPVRSRAASPRVPAVAFCQGTVLRNEIEARSPPGLAEATDACTAALAERFGRGAVDGKIQAHVITAQR